MWHEIGQGSPWLVVKKTKKNKQKPHCGLVIPIKKKKKKKNKLRSHEHGRKPRWKTFNI